MINRLLGQRVYFDTNPFIYFVEGHDVFHDAVSPLFECIDNAQFFAYTSQLTLTELLIKPYRDDLPDMVAAYEGLLLESGFFSVLGFDESSFLLAAQLGGALRLRPPDALHVAAALEHECHYFITNDRRIRSHKSLHVIQLSDLL